MTIYIDIHNHKKVGSEQVIELTNLYHYQEVPKGGFYSIGLHPWHIFKVNIDNAMAALEKRAAFENVLAIGETGLDRLIETPLNTQIKLLRYHVEIAQSLNKPIIIHCVRAYPELLKELKNTQVPVVFHGFRANRHIAEQIIEHGYYISFGAYTLTSDEKLYRVLRLIPTERLFLETDESSVSIHDIYASVANILQRDIHELEKSIISNYKRVFKVLNR